MPSATATVFTVTTPADGGAGSFREAIELANAAGVEARVVFAINSGPTTIRLTAPLPPIAFAGLIDGWTQPGYADQPMVEISGAGAPAGSGLEIVGGGLTARGLAVTGWPEHGILVHGCDDVVLVGLHVGVGLDGATADGNGGCGIRAERAERLRVGTPADGVVISGNAGYGILAAHGANRFQLEASFVGSDRTGRLAVPNQKSGVKVEEAYGAMLGGLSDGSGNVISGNRLYGVEIGGPQSRDAVVIGNHVGCDAAGLAAIPNGRTGILVYNTPHVRIGGVTAREANVISGGSRGGINLDGSIALRVNPDGSTTIIDDSGYAAKGNARNILIQGNLIGVDRTGERPLGNQLRGILITYAQDNTVIDNVISGNGEDGVLILGPADDSDPNLTPSGNRVLHNRIGVTMSGQPCGNGRFGVLVMHGMDNAIGGGADDANVISWNGMRGVMFNGLGARTNVLSTFDTVANNKIGEFHQPRE